ncbi:hypothetical protein GVN16_03430 [Emticicia sp. CRIBPO]|uniref:hypothetical protein n=1 Tax=Emticicia sp. CRIBPO TaxID=2683258 RepID=UPI0014135D80|nr:hypothetical protein [Emticicia sp. CRIBPO]NBA84792.1 hypothetical protein [Emticicia sp. CRIBPO]
MNTKLLISFNSDSINIGSIGFSLGLFGTFIQLGYLGCFIAIIFALIEFSFLSCYQVFLDESSFYLSRLLTTDIKYNKKDLIEFTIKKRHLIFTVYCLKFNNGQIFNFIKIPKSMLESNEFSIKDFLNDLVISNSGNSK